MEEEDVLEALRRAFPGDVLETGTSLGDPWAVVRPEALAARRRLSARRRAADARCSST